MSGFIWKDQGGPYPAQSRIFEADSVILGSGAGGRGVASGCAVTEAGTPAMSVVVASGSVVIARVVHSVSGGTVALSAADATNPRFDLIYADDAGAVHVRTGTPAVSPTYASPDDDEVGLAMVYVPATDTAVQNAQIVDKRVFVETPASAAGWTTISAAGDRTRSNTSALAADDDLHFTLGANTKYRIRAVLFGSAKGTGSNSGVKIGFTGPASPTQVFARSHKMTLTQFAAETVVGYDAYDTTGVTLGLNQADWDWVFSFDAVVHNGSNATPDFSITWAQSVAVAENTVRRAGSWLEYAVA